MLLNLPMKRNGRGPRGTRRQSIVQDRLGFNLDQIIGVGQGRHAKKGRSREVPFEELLAHGSDALGVTDVGDVNGQLQDVAQGSARRRDQGLNPPENLAGLTDGVAFADGQPEGQFRDAGAAATGTKGDTMSATDEALDETYPASDATAKY